MQRRNTPMLPYAVAQPRCRITDILRRRFFATLAWLLVLLTLLSAPVVYRFPWVLYGSTAAYAWHRARMHTDPLDRVIYEEDPLKANALLFRKTPDGIWQGLPAGFQPRVIHDLAGDFPSFVAFVHERVAAGSRARLVLVCLRPIRERGRGSTRTGLELAGRSIARSGPFSDSVLGPVLDIPLGSVAARVFAGQPDARDKAHFIIRYEIDERAGTIDGWLQPDNTVRLQIRDGPAITGAVQSQ